MTALPSLLRDGHDPVSRARNCPANEQQIALGIHLDHPEPELRVALGALMPRHFLALDDARRVGARADGARLPVPRVAMRGRPATEPMAVHDALEAAALGRAGHLHQLARGEDVYLH